MTDPAPSIEPDELSKSMNDWQLECAIRLRTEYGHSWGAASGLAALMRDTLEEGLRKPRPLFVITGF